MDENEVFSAGVRPGGLLNGTQIRILVCYILANLEDPFPRQEMQAIFHAQGYANYFSLSQVIQELQKSGSICRADGEDNYTITEAGREAARELASALPRSVREGALAAARDRKNQLHSLRQGNTAEIQEADGGFTVTCTVREKNRPLMQVSLWLPLLSQAERVRSVFLRDPSKIYGGVIAYLSGEK